MHANSFYAIGLLHNPRICECLKVVGISLIDLLNISGFADNAVA